MDLSRTAEQQLLVESARSFLAHRCPIEHVRAMERDERGFDPELWREMAALGWQGIAVPEEYGGSGQTFLETALLLEEMGRVLLPAPFLATAAMVAPLLLALGNEEQRQRWLPGIAAGQVVATLAILDPGVRDEWHTSSLIAQRDGNEFRCSGRKRLVPFAAQSDLIVTVVQLQGLGTALLAVEQGTSGLSCTRRATLGGDHLYDVCFDDVRVPQTAVLGEAGASSVPALARLPLRACTGSLAYIVGAAERVLEMTIDYAKTRTQFGRPIGSFQAVAHRCVDMRSDIDALRYLVYQAAWSLAEERPSEFEVSAAKTYGNEALRRIFKNAHQVHGAIGFSTEYDLQLFTRRAKAAELQWGSTSLHAERVARAMGL
jgi:alkylation response protein AidB-like acyl-CoA dehydrogenase